MTPDMGVCGGVVQGSPLKDGFELAPAATPGTLPSVGVGLLPMACEDSVAIEEIEFERVGLGGRGGAGDAEGGMVGGGCLSKDAGADVAVGVGVGVACAEETVESGAGEG